MITSSGIICDICDEYVLINTFKTIEGIHICSKCEKVVKEILKNKKSINTEELRTACKSGKGKQ